MGKPVSGARNVAPTVAPAATSGRRECGTSTPLARRVAALTDDLARYGASVDLHQRGAQFLASGVTARVAMGSLAAADAGGARNPDRGLAVVYSALRAGIPVTVTVIDPAGQASDDSLRQFRLRFGEFLSAAGVERRLLGLCLADSELPSPEFRAELRPSLGDGPRYVMLHDVPVAAPRAPPVGEDLWQLLRIEERGRPRFWPAFASGVRSQCPLLTAESASAVLPGSGLVAPVGSAWLPIRINLCAFLTRQGTLDDRRLKAALGACVDLGDRLFDCVSWFDDRQRRDARRNRRLAICIEGIGDLVERCGVGPADFASLRMLDAALARCRQSLWSASRALAASRGPLPSIAEHSPSFTAGDDGCRRAWQRRWQTAVANGQVRHRNLLALSPCALFPRDGRASPEFADLLPLLAHADALYFARPPSLTHWNVSEFMGFHRRLAAQVERHNAAAFIAAGV